MSDLVLDIEEVEYNEELADTNMQENEWNDKITDGIGEDQPEQED